MTDHIFALHDQGGEHLIRESGKTGWVVFAEKVGDDPNDHGGKNFNTQPGISAICRLAFGWYGEGNIPDSSRYERFAQRCANYVAASQGCKRWIVGNEMNLTAERPILPNGEGQVVTPEMYGKCFKMVRDKIKAVQPNAELIIGGVAPWNNQTSYPGNESGDWVKYYVDTLKAIGAYSMEGIALHTYTHGRNVDLVYSDTKMGPPFQDRHYNFRAFEDFLVNTPGSCRHMPVYITEFDADTDLWGENNGLIQAAYGAINHWNNRPGNQKILCLALYRWGNYDKWEIGNKGGSLDDFRKAMTQDYRHNYTPATPTPDVPVRPVLGPRQARVTAEAGLNLREAPEATAAIKAVLSSQSVVEKIATHGDWMRVRYDGIEGYVWAGYMEEL